MASKFMDVRGLRMHYVDEGQGEPVVLLHGNPTWSFMYRDLIASLSRREPGSPGEPDADNNARPTYRCIAPDHIGMGLSDKPGDDRYAYTLKSRVDDLEVLLEGLGLRENLTLVVHDWGGMIGMAYASRRPERVARLVVMNTAAFLIPEGKRLPWQLKLGRDSKLGALAIRGFNAFAKGATTACCTRRPMAPEVRREYLRPYDSWANRIAVLRFVQDIPLSPEDPAYPIVREVQNGLERFKDVPMLICWGEKDFVFDGDFLNEWTRRFPRAETHRFPEASHYVLEDEGPAIAGLVRKFLAAHPLPRVAPLSR